MTEKTTYICDICGKEFEDEESCLAHEKEEKHKEFENRVALFDSDGNLVDDITCAFTIYVADKEAFDYVNELLDESGYCDIPFDFFNKEEILNIFYTDDNGDWSCLSSDLNELLKLEKNVIEALDNRPKV